MAADILATQGARASAAMILTELNRDNSVPARWGLIKMRCIRCRVKTAWYMTKNYAKK